MKRFLMWGGTVLALLLLVGGGWLLTRPKPPAPSNDTRQRVPENEAGKAGDVAISEEAMKLAEITLAPVEVKLVQERLKVSGSVQVGGKQLARVTPSAPGKVTRLLAQVGDRVRAGQVLAVLESADLARMQAEYRQARSRVDALSEALGRQRELARLGQFGRPQVEQSRTERVSSERDVHEAEHHLQEEQARLAHDEADLEVSQARLKRAQQLSDLVASQEMERIQGEFRKAEAARAGARARVTAAHGDLRLARERLAIAKREWRREEKVFQGGFHTSRELVEAESALRLAQVDEESAAEGVRLLGGTPGQGSRVELISPIAGQVQQCNVTLGQTVAADQAAYTVVDLSQVWVHLALPAREQSKVRVGDLVELTADSAPDRVFRGRLAHLDATSDETTRALYVRARLDNPAHLLKIGSYVKGSVITDVRDRRLTVPPGALQEHTGRPTLYVSTGRPGNFEVRHVVLGTSGQKWREVAEGLKPGESVAVTGTFYLKSEALKSSLSDGCCGGGQ